MLQKTHAFVQVRAQPAQKANLAKKLPGGNDKEKSIQKMFHMVSPQVPLFNGTPGAGNRPSRTKIVYILSKEV